MEPKTIPEDLMVELEESLKKCQRLFAQINAINERNQVNDYREWQKDYEGNVGC